MIEVSDIIIVDKSGEVLIHISKEEGDRCVVKTADRGEIVAYFSGVRSSCLFQRIAS
jgi:hypothetical protein